MDGRVLYLDVDDEITSAAARIRGAEGTRVALVLPYGSRLATSRINFRLLARDATLNGKRLSIVAGDAATRALAASAGLPIFASVAEYESSIAEERGERAGDATSDSARADPAALASSAAPASPEAPEPAAPEPIATTPAPASTRSPRARRKPREPADDTAATPTPALPAAAGQPPRLPPRRRPSRRPSPWSDQPGTSARRSCTHRVPRQPSPRLASWPTRRPTSFRPRRPG